MSGSIFQTVINRPERPTDRLSAAIAWFKTWVFRKTASLRRYRIRVAAVLVLRSTILLALAGTRAYIHSRDVALDHMVFLLRALPLCLARHYRMRFNFRGVYISRICNFRVFRVFKFAVAGYSGVEIFAGEIFADIRSESVYHNSTVKPV